MSESLFDELLKAAEEGRSPSPDALQKLQKVYAAESRAADEVAPRALQGRFRFAPGLDWLEWDGTRWLIDTGGEDRARQAVRRFMDRTEKNLRAAIAALQKQVEDLEAEVLGQASEAEVAAAEDDPKVKAALISTYADEVQAKTWKRLNSELYAGRQQAEMWLNLLSESKIGNITKLCRRDDGIFTKAAAFDTHHDLLNCPNGVVDLRTGNVKAHDPELLITQVTGVAYDPDATSKRWDQALGAVQPEAAEWFQVRVGQSLTGHTPDDDSLTLCEGGGSNGKTTVMAGITRAAGSYFTLVSHRVLIAQPGQHPTEMMDLRGARFALLEETPEEGRLDTHQLKMTVGTPKMKARHMRQNTVEWDATHTLWINTNHTPQVDATDKGTWRRLKRMPWPYTFTKTPTEDHHRKGDNSLRPAILNDPGIPSAVLAWCVAGAVKWYAQRADPMDDPAPVADAWREWRSESDVGYQFAQERLIADRDCFITADLLRRAFDEFLDDQGKRPWSQKLINQRFPASIVEALGVKVENRPERVKAGMTESRRDLPPPPSTSWDRDPHAQERVAPRAPVGKTVRLWSGIRFQTASEMAGEPNLRVVGGDSSPF